MIDIIYKKYKALLIIYECLIIYNVEVEETNIIIPIDEMIIEITGISSFNNNSLYSLDNSFSNEGLKICKRVREFIRTGYSSFDELFSSYIETVIYLIEKYGMKETINILKLFSTIFENAVYFELGKSLFKFYELGILTILEYFKTNIPDKKTFLFISLGIFPTRIKKDFTEYINLIGIDIYKMFMNEMYSYIKNESSANFNIWHNCFIQHCLKINVLGKEKIEEIILLFMEKNLLTENGLKLLKNINSSYIDKYSARLLMEELKEDI